MMGAPRLFLSHSHKDNLWCDQFVGALSALGCEVWYDRQGLYVGAQWIQTIQQELAQSDVFVVILTPESTHSDWVQEEVSAALALRKQIVGVMLRNTDLSPFLASRQILFVEQESPATAATLVLKGLERDTSAQPHSLGALTSVRPLFMLPAATAEIKDIAWSPDGVHIAVANADKVTRVWNWKTRQTVLTLAGHSKAVTSVAWSADNARLLTGSEDKTGRVWDAQTGRLILTVSGHRGFLVGVAVAWSADAARFATACSDVTWIWDAQTGQRLRELRVKSGYGMGSTSFNGLSWSRDGAHIASVNSSTAWVWTTTGSQEQPTLYGHGHMILDVAWSPDNSRVATCSANRLARIWNPLTGQTILDLLGHTRSVNGIDWSPDSRYVATASDDGSVRIWDARTGQNLQTVTASGGVSSVAWSPDGAHLATAVPKQGIQVWELS